MSERTIAEILGKAEQLGHRHPQGADGDCIAYECQTCFEWVSEYAQTLCPANWTNDYTVDDLLAWLSLDVFFLVYVTRVDGIVSIDFIATDSGLDQQSFEAPTLLAALEAAVRAVDAATSLPNPA